MTLPSAIQPPGTRLWFMAALGVALTAGCIPADRVDELQANRQLLLNPDDPAWNRHAPGMFIAEFATSKGDFAIEVHREWAPLGADRFFNLVRHDFYDQQRFNRVREGFITQWGLSGDPAVTAAWEDRAFPDDPVRESNLQGYIAYAMTGPDTRLTQVYVNMADNSRLDEQGFAPFGRVIEGMDVVASLYSGYDETAGGGMRGGLQGQIKAEGNVYLDRDYPLLDRLIRATIREPSTGN